LGISDAVLNYYNISISVFAYCIVSAGNDPGSFYIISSPAKDPEPIDNLFCKL